MKKLISLLCVLTLVIGVAAVSAVSADAAVDAAKTMIDVKNGQDVTYRLKLGGVESKVIGSEFSVYYDPAVLEVVSVLDFSDNDEDNWAGNWLANPNLDGEVSGNFSILRGVKFDETRSFITVKFKAKANATTDISYFIRYLYDYKIFLDDAMKNKTQPQITDFKFTCDVTVDGDPVLEDAQPELNVDASQDKGIFINSVTGDSNDTDVDIAGVVANKEKAVTAYDYSKSVAYDAAQEDTMLYGDGESGDADSGSGDNGGSGSGGSGSVGSVSGGVGGGSGSSGSSSSAPESVETIPEKTADGYYITAVDDNGNVIGTADEAHFATPTSAAGTKGGSSPVIWIVIALVVIAGCGAGVYFYMKKKNGGAPSPDGPVDAAPADNAPAEEAPAETPENNE